MLVSLQWLREFVPYEGEAQALGDRLTMLGLELESIHDPFESIRDIVVGHVVECVKHPEADKLSVCTVDVGEGAPLTIVCGAPNVAKGQNVPVAKVGTTLPDGLKIKKAKLRGVPSTGMICSERELAMSEAHDGILVLPESLKPGQRMADALGLEDTVLDVDITPNKADCLSILGVARETALGFDLPLTMPKLGLAENGEGNAAELMNIVIDDPALCPLYQARIIKGVDQKVSPAWMRYRLLAVGQRPISNIVDVTNFIMFELGQPLHSFDLDRIEGGMIRVAPAEEGSTIVTLDGQTRKLLASDILIWDGKKPVALAGVMGGENSEMIEGSRNVLLESAVFNPGSVRRTARRLALPSEASYRFERGVDQVMNSFALDRAAQLMAELSGGAVVPGVTKAEPRPWVDRIHRYRHDRCLRLLGVELEPDFAKKTFSLMGCAVDDADPVDWKVSTPSHRLDLEREVDLYEEVARVYGMDRIPAVLPHVSKSLDAPQRSESHHGFVRRLKAWGQAAGLREAINYSFVGDDNLDLLGEPEDVRVHIANPLSADQNVMRTAIAAGLLNTLKHNLAKGNFRLRLFEVAKAFFADPSSDTETRENMRLGLLVHGARHAQDWPWQNGDADYLDAKGLVEHLLDSLKLGPAEFVLREGPAYLEPAVDVLLDGRSVGFLGKVKADVADEHHARKDVWMADLDVDLLREIFLKSRVLFKPLPVFPPSRRDVTVTAPLTLHVGKIERTVLDLNLPLLEKMELVAVFQPESTPDEHNVSFRMTYRHANKTLKDKDVDKEHAKVVAALTEKLPVRIPSA